MNEKEIIEFLEEDDVVFFVDGKLSSICPLEKVGVSFGENRTFFSTMKEAIHAKIFNEKSILDLWDEIFPQIS